MEPDKQDAPCDWMRQNDVAKMLKVDKRTLKRWRDDGILPYATLGGTIYIRRSDIEKRLLDSMKSH